LLPPRGEGRFRFVVIRFEDGQWKEVTAVPLDAAFDAFWA